MTVFVEIRLKIYREQRVLGKLRVSSMFFRLVFPFFVDKRVKFLMLSSFVVLLFLQKLGF